MPPSELIAKHNFKMQLIRKLLPQLITFKLPACKRILTPKWVISATTGDFSLHTYKTCFKPLPLVIIIAGMSRMTQIHVSLNIANNCETVVIKNDTSTSTSNNSQLTLNKRPISWKSDKDETFGSDVFPKNFQNGSLIGSGHLNESIPCAQKIAVYLISYKKNEKKEVGVNAFLPTVEAIEGDDNVGVALLTYPVLMTLDRCPNPGP
ncbi:hypothetical protein L1987_86800 [Smallanthus sonchifolius]|uniref:Uncharacterized protein n=1 Tax=Smallanthus sonchifolius TaxID=185202 RepID=A0ACB8Y161_9ASTR|nr:hypothetical protein L1987_86800 [Smallanthus sonchifolius]